MKLRILLIAVISTAWAQTKTIERPVRAPQGQIKYDGGFVPQDVQWQSYLANVQRSERAEGISPHRPRQAQQTPQRAPARQPQRAQQAQPEQLQRLPQEQIQQYYRPYSAVPSHIKQLIEQTYQPQPPYVDPTSFLYSASFAAPQQYEQQQQQQQQPAPAASEVPRSAYAQPSARYQSIEPRGPAQPQFAYSDRRVERQDRIAYRQDYEQQQEQQQAPQVALPAGTMPEPPAPTLYLDKNMPTELRQLLQYQAQIPYDVIANRIHYKPKSIFIPKPLSDDVKGPYYYRSKIYYTDDVNDEAEYPQQSKPAEEEQRH